ncbi:UDP-glucuronate 5-epimerase [Alsobacter soli]|uniref:UDP-glucuronate 5-epimerase n=1 Tax=Alsobacter soli TaxID=2109933 RepID=A0A2T1HPZ0_9HYPH|nr:NAD-dependent epimerase/dehydratase family protein [Alsobacter soli]PSC03710.1 UDP-glucuronate 5-epimerase [Alsobacter soli]
MHVLVTGSAGFVGFHLSRRLLRDGATVTGVDGMTRYYDVSLKEKRLELLGETGAFARHDVMLEDMDALSRVYRDAKPDVVVHLAAQAGVRYSLENPRAYVDANLVGTFNVLELAREGAPRHLLMASTSSVYGANREMPFREDMRADMPMTLYAATKRATEHMAHSYAHLWNLPTTMMRFFTVYGPWGRPDMALFKFVEAIEAGRPIDVYGHGDMRRDFTYVDDLVESMVRLIDCVPETGGPGASEAAPFRVVNIAGGAPTGLNDYIAAAERALGKKAIRNELPMQAGDVRATHADNALLLQLTGYAPSTPVDQGVAEFVRWWRGWRGSNTY